MNNMNSIKVPSNGNNSHSNGNGNNSKYNQSPNGSPFKNTFFKNYNNESSDTDEL